MPSQPPREAGSGEVVCRTRKASSETRNSKTRRRRRHRRPFRRPPNSGDEASTGCGLFRRTAEWIRNDCEDELSPESATTTRLDRGTKSLVATGARRRPAKSGPRRTGARLPRTRQVAERSRGVRRGTANPRAD